MNILRRIWIPVLIVALLAVGGIAIYRLHGVFGTQVVASTPDIRSETAPYPPKNATYEVTGPAGTTGTVSYLDEKAQPRHAAFTTLPWSHTMTARTPGIFAYVAARGDSDSIGCRIVVNGQLKEQQSSSDVNAQTACLLKSG